MNCDPSISFSPSIRSWLTNVHNIIETLLIIVVELSST